MLCPNYKVPSRKTLSNNLLEQLYQSLRNSIQEELDHVDSICVTNNSWTSSNNENFTAITAHYLIVEESQLVLKSRLLDLHVCNLPDTFNCYTAPMIIILTLFK